VANNAQATITVVPARISETAWDAVAAYEVYASGRQTCARAHLCPRRSKPYSSDAYWLAYLLYVNDLACRRFSCFSHLVLYLCELTRAFENTLLDQRCLTNRRRYLLPNISRCNIPVRSWRKPHLPCLSGCISNVASPRKLTRYQLRQFLIVVKPNLTQISHCQSQPLTASFR
jgi:hypothetical protein